MNERDEQEKNQAGHADENGDTPGAVGYPEPGSGHDDSRTVTVEDGPPVNTASRGPLPEENKGQ